MVIPGPSWPLMVPNRRWVVLKHLLFDLPLPRETDTALRGGVVDTSIGRPKAVGLSCIFERRTSGEVNFRLCTELHAMLLTWSLDGISSTSEGNWIYIYICMLPPPPPPQKKNRFWTWIIAKLTGQNAAFEKCSPLRSAYFSSSRSKCWQVQLVSQTNSQQVS